MRIFRLIFAFLVTLWVVVPASAVSDSADAPHVHVRLVVPAQGMTRGAATDAGLYFKLESGWHVYWKNPGDAGEPPHALGQGRTCKQRALRCFLHSVRQSVEQAHRRALR